MSLPRGLRIIRAINWKNRRGSRTSRTVAPEPEFMNEIIPGLFLGSLAAAYDTAALHKAGITHVLTAMNLGPGVIRLDNLSAAQPSFTLLQLPILDTPFFDLLSLLPQCVAFIQGALDAGGKVLVHCYKGVSRSATVVVAHLVAARGLAPVEALTLVRARRPCVAPNWGFVRQLEKFYRAQQAARREDEKLAATVTVDVAVALASAPVRVA